jgi:hypothetical protein
MGARSLSPLFMGVAVICYLAAVVIALPLGITGVVRQADALLPLAIGAVMITIGSILQTRGG